jgi:hypothetical protein
VSAFQVFLSESKLNTERIQSIYLLEEGVEVMRFFRDTEWTSISGLTTDTPYYIYFDNSAWSTTTTATSTLNGFSRSISIEDVFRRDSDDIIIASTSADTKTLDLDTKLITVEAVSPLGNKRTLSVYLTDLFDN